MSVNIIITEHTPARSGDSTAKMPGKLLQEQHHGFSAIAAASSPCFAERVFSQR
jgi:hypothetical protein